MQSVHRHILSNSKAVRACTAMATTEEQLITEQEAEPAAEQEAEPATVSASPGASADGGGTPSDMVAWFESTITEYEATFIVFYRGYW